MRSFIILLAVIHTSGVPNKHSCAHGDIACQAERFNRRFTRQKTAIERYLTERTSTLQFDGESDSSRRRLTDDTDTIIDDINSKNLEIFRGIDQPLQIKPLTGGLSNVMYLVFAPRRGIAGGKIERAVVVRMYNKHTPPTQAEIRTMTFMREITEVTGRVGPRLLATFEWGQVEQWFDSRSLAVEDVTGKLAKVETRSLIAKKLGNLHSIPRENYEHVNFGFDIQTERYGIFPKIRMQLAAAREAIQSSGQSERWKNYLGKNWDHELHLLRLKLMQFAPEVQKQVFSHNDFHPGNILELRNVSPLDLVVIDYEYASPNTPVYDLGNFFCELNVMGKDAGFEVLYHSPNEEFRREFVTSYLHARTDLTYDKELENEFVRASYVGEVLSHLFWGFWGIEGSVTRTEIEFPYSDYAVVRLNRYQTEKEAVLKDVIKQKKE